MLTLVEVVAVTLPQVLHTLQEIKEGLLQLVMVEVMVENQLMKQVDHLMEIQEYLTQVEVVAVVLIIQAALLVQFLVVQVVRGGGCW